MCLPGLVTWMRWRGFSTVRATATRTGHQPPRAPRTSADVL